MKSPAVTLSNQSVNGWNAQRLLRGGGMMVVRVNLRLALCSLCLAGALLMLYWSQCIPLSIKPGGGAGAAGAAGGGAGGGAGDAGGAGAHIECRVNGEYSVACRREGPEVYVPFSFIHKYFEVYGKIARSEGVERFQWSHSYSRVHRPARRYDPRGAFATFANYNVEVRDRVLCVSGAEGVPVSTQWEPRGFYYPTQIAQYGLAHYSRNLTEPDTPPRALDDGAGARLAWSASGAVLARGFDAALGAPAVSFAPRAAAGYGRVRAAVGAREPVLSVRLRLRPGAAMTVVLRPRDPAAPDVHLHYNTSDDLIWAQDNHVYHGLGGGARWRRVTRDLLVDMQKGWAFMNRPKVKSPRNKYEISTITFTGEGAFASLSVAARAHGAAVWAAADWLVRRQRDGGWPVPVRRRIAAGVAELEPGWHSAMSQGHAISLLSRAYVRSGRAEYLRAARAALRPLAAPSAAGGVRALWMDKYVWYEEYPTTPPLFVLNGFIYALLGLYDLHATEAAEGAAGEEGGGASLAKRMFDDGMTSLKALLPLFDSGSGSFYDLRHVTLGVSPNVARWDYHATHVNQLYLLAGLDADPLLLRTARRWEGYMQGKRAAHN